MIRNTAIPKLPRRLTVATVALWATCLVGGTAAHAQTCDPATSGVGAHLAHTRDSFAGRALPCTECHAPVCTPSPASNVVFGALASRNGAQPAWDPATRTCSGVYCHGSTLANPVGPVTWTYVDVTIVRPLSQQCVVCHGYPPRAPHEAATACNMCHASVAADGTVDLAGGLHPNGTVDVSGGACGSCHGNPPATGAHVAHYGLDGGSGFSDLSTLEDRNPGATPTSAPQVYAFGCGSCHPIATGLHRNGTADVVLYEAAAAAGSLKSKASPTASYDRATGTCSGVYCHSSGQETPVYVTTPGWRSGETIGCAGCHSNPPAYASGGAGSATANSHLALADDGYEFGHFLGMPGAWHTSKHGENGWGAGEDATAITCQTCHYDTTDPSNTGPSGFYYLDTTGNYALPGGDPGRISSGWQAGIQCGSCHNAGGAATGTGKVLPLRHVNGRRDVVFDSRTALPSPAISWLPAAPNTPTGPYWMTGTQRSMPYPPSVSWSASGTTVSFGLDGSAYDPATKTCSGVACHLAQLQPRWGTPYQYYTNSSATCYTCHPM